MLPTGISTMALAGMLMVIGPAPTAGSDTLSTNKITGCGGISVTPSEVLSTWTQHLTEITWSTSDNSASRADAVRCYGTSNNDSPIVYWYFKDDKPNSDIVVCASETSPARCCPKTLAKLSWVEKNGGRVYSLTPC